MITKASDVAPRPTSAEVELEDLQTNDGGKVTVLCRPVSPEVIFRAWERLTGGGPETQDPDREKTPEEKLEDAIATAKLASQSTPIIEAGAFLEPAEGELELVLLASIVPISSLSLRDRGNLVATISMLSGVGTKAADSARFRYEYRGGLGNGDGAGRDVPGLSPEPVGSPPAGA